MALRGVDLEFRCPSEAQIDASKYPSNGHLGCWRWFVNVLKQSNLENLRQQIENLGAYDLHNILRQQKKVEWSEWHLNINENDKAIEIAEEFHQNFKKIEVSSSIIAQVDTIEETFLKFMPKDGDWIKIRDCFKQAREQDNPLLIVTAYTCSTALSRRLNTHSAVNTYHALKLYCTLLNCPILAQTQEYTEAFTRILFRPKLNQYIVRQGTFYRGIFLEDKKLVDNYKEGEIIITTTFLSTSRNPNIANIFNGTDPNIANYFIGTDSNVPNWFSGTNPNVASYYSDRDPNVVNRFSNRDLNVFNRFSNMDLNVVNRFSDRDLNVAHRFGGMDPNLANRSDGTDLNIVDHFSGANPNAVNSIDDTIPENAISIFCIYNINNTNRHTALNITSLSDYRDEDEILILRYAPFMIKSVKRTDDGRGMKICFDECKENYTVKETRS